VSKRASGLVLSALILAVSWAAWAGSGPRAPAPGWVPIGPPGGDVADLVLAPGVPGRIYAVLKSELGQIFASDDAGQSWTRLAVFEEPVYSLAIDSSNPQVMHVLGKGAALNSSDGGASWTRSPLGEYWYGEDGEIAVHPLDPQLVLATGYHCYQAPESWASGPAFFRSDDGGASWARLCLDATELQGQGLGLAVDPLDAGTFFVAGYVSDLHSRSARLFRSQDGGETWTDTAPVWGFAVEDVLVNPANPATMLAATPVSVYISADGGLSWAPTDAFDCGSNFHTLAADPLEPGVLYAGGADLVLRSADGGLHWTGLPASPEGACQAFLARGQELLQGSPSGVWRSKNGGSSWSFSANGMDATNVRTVLVVPASPEVIYAVTGGTIWRTRNGGADWDILPWGLADQSGELVVHPRDPNVLYAYNNFGYD
jgi:photosystem II stability/assembly factor-like uncharacterized protein